MPFVSGFVGKVLGIDESITFRGDTVKELKADFQAAVDHYIADCTATGRTPVKTASGKMMLRISPETHTRALILTLLTSNSKHFRSIKDLKLKVFKPKKLKPSNTVTAVTIEGSSSGAGGPRGRVRSSRSAGPVGPDLPARKLLLLLVRPHKGKADGKPRPLLKPKSDEQS